MTPLVQDYESLLAKIRLQKGAHVDRSNGLCVMEAVAYVAGEPHSDRPPCASKVITAFLVNWNDSLPTDEDRDRLLGPLVPLIVDTAAGPEIELRRAYMALDWLLRECAATFLVLTPSLVEHAEALRASPGAVDLATLKAIQPKAAAARAAARAAAWDAAMAAVRDAAMAAVRDAARDAVRDAAMAAARDAARDAAMAAAMAAARDAARVAAMAAARDAARDAVRDAAYKRLATAVESLQASAVLLVRRMCEVGKETA